MSSFARWAFAAAVVAGVLLALGETSYAPVAAALAALIFVSVLFMHGGNAWNELTSLVGVNPAKSATPTVVQA